MFKLNLSVWSLKAEAKSYFADKIGSIIFQGFLYSFITYGFISIVSAILSNSFDFSNLFKDFNSTDSTIVYADFLKLSMINLVYNLLVLGPISLGIAILCLKIINGNEISNLTMFEGFSHMGKSIGIKILITLFMLIAIIPCYIIIVVIAVFALVNIFGNVNTDTSSVEFLNDLGSLSLTDFGVPLLLIFLVLVILIIFLVYIYLRYSLSYYILSDNENIKATKTLKISAQMMKGNYGKGFLIHLSFIGYVILFSFLLAGITYSVSNITNNLIIINVINSLCSCLIFSYLIMHLYSTYALFFKKIKDGLILSGFSVSDNGMIVPNNQTNN